MSSQPGLFLTWLSTDIAAGSQFSTPPASITVNFDRVLDPSSLSYDVLLDRVNSDGSLTSVFDTGPASSESLTPGQTGLVVSFNQNLGPGHYEVFLSSLAGLSGQDGAMLDSSGTNVPLIDFQVVAPTISTASAPNLGVLGPSSVGVVTRFGTLDFQADPTDVKLYQLTLPEGHFWRLGLEVQAQRLGSSLDSALALFDSQGNLIATDEVGRRDAPADPYLYVGLPAGTYYVGVSGKGDLPGQPGGYSLMSGSAGAVKQSQQGGWFVLDAVADPADLPVSLRYLTLDRADPMSPAPTGLTVAFSGTLQVDATPGILSQSLSQGIEVVDQNGKAWPVAAVGYNENQAAISYLFLDSLPPGQYTVRLPAQGGLKDLAGWAPVAPGLPQGVLGKFQVSPATTVRDPSNLGAMLPHAVEAGVEEYAMLDAGASSMYRMVITYPGAYAIQSEVLGGPAAVMLTGSKGRSWSFDAGAQGVINENLAYLTPGVYHVRLINTADRMVMLKLDVKLPAFDTESLLQNGIGQDSAMALRLIAPTGLPAPSVSADPSAATAPGSAGAVLAAGQTGLPVVASLAGGSNLNAAPIAWWSGYYVGDWVGRPARLGDHVAATDAGALAMNRSDLSYGGLGIFPRTNSVPRGRRPVAAGQEPGRRRTMTEASELPKNGAMVGEADLPAPQLSDADAIDENWLDRLWAEFARQDLAGVTGQVGLRAAPVANSSDAQTLAEELAANSIQNVEEAQLQSAALTSPLAAGCAAALFMHYRHQIEQWLAHLRRGPRARLSRLRPHAASQARGRHSARQLAHRQAAQPA